MKSIPQQETEYSKKVYDDDKILKFSPPIPFNVVVVDLSIGIPEPKVIIFFLIRLKPQH